MPYKNQGQDLDNFTHLKRWFETIQSRPATIRAYEKGKQVNSAQPVMTDEARKVLFGQTAAVVR